MLFSNLGGRGPLSPSGASAGSQGIRYVNAGTFSRTDGVRRPFDLLLTNTSGYTPHDASRNALVGPFAQINLACNSDVRLRVATVEGCASAPSCALCGADDACFAAGCACFGETVHARDECEGAAKEGHRASYECTQMHTPFVLPGSALVALGATRTLVS